MTKLYAKGIKNKLNAFDSNYNYDITDICINEIGASSSNPYYKMDIKGVPKNGGEEQYFRLSLLQDPQTKELVLWNSISQNATRYGKCFQDYELTENPFYHPQIDGILTCFFIIFIVCILIPFKIFSRAFGRWLKV